MRNSGGHGKILAWGRAKIIEDETTVSKLRRGRGGSKTLFFSRVL